MPILTNEAGTWTWSKADIKINGSTDEIFKAYRRKSQNEIKLHKKIGT